MFWSVTQWDLILHSLHYFDEYIAQVSKLNGAAFISFLFFLCLFSHHLFAMLTLFQYATWFSVSSRGPSWDLLFFWDIVLMNTLIGWVNAVARNFFFFSFHALILTISLHLLQPPYIFTCNMSAHQSTASVKDETDACPRKHCKLPPVLLVSDDLGCVFPTLRFSLSLLSNTKMLLKKACQAKSL